MDPDVKFNEVEQRLSGIEKRIDDEKSSAETNLKARFEDLDKRFEGVDKRHEDIKWYIGGAATLFTVVFSVLTLLLSWNYKDERDRLRQFEEDLKKEIGKVEALPALELLGTNGEPLADQEIAVSFVTSTDNTNYIRIGFGLRNIGDGGSGPLYFKFYASDPIRLSNKSTDDKRFQYEDYITPASLSPSEIPGKYSTEYHLDIPMKTSPPAPGKYPASLKVFYGKGKTAQAKFAVIVSSK